MGRVGWELKTGRLWRNEPMDLLLRAMASFTLPILGDAAGPLCSSLAGLGSAFSVSLSSTFSLSLSLLFFFFSTDVRSRRSS
jgi:hypothetical protein